MGVELSVETNNISINNKSTPNWSDIRNQIDNIEYHEVKMALKSRNLIS